MSFISCKPSVEEVWVCRIWSKRVRGRLHQYFRHKTLSSAKNSDWITVRELIQLINKTRVSKGTPVLSPEGPRYSVALFNGDENEEASVFIAPPVIWLPEGKVGIVAKALPSLLDELVEQGKEKEFDLLDFIRDYVQLEPYKAAQSA